LSDLTQFAFARLVEDFERRFVPQAYCHPDNEREFLERLQAFHGPAIRTKISDLMPLDMVLVILPGDEKPWLIDLKAERAKR
jgi:hypothetical protein